MGKPSDLGRPRVSVLLPVYNGERFLRETLDSAFAQTMPNLEVIAVDDGSSDGSVALLEAEGDPRLRVLRQSNLGAPTALNTALDAVRGEYLGFLDQDDLWSEQKLERHLEVMDDNPKLDLTFSRYELIDEASQRMGIESRRWLGEASYEQLLEDYVIGATSTVLMRRSVIDRAGPFDPTFPRYYDVDLFLRASLLGPDNVCAVPDILTFYRRHGNQMSSDWRQMRREWVRLLEKVKALAPEKTEAAERTAWTNMNRYFACLSYEAGNYRVATGLLWRGFRCKPSGFLFDRRNWRVAAACLSGLVLPARVHRALESLASGTRR